MNTKEIADRLRDIAAVLNALGDLNKVVVLNRAADRLEELEFDRNHLMELMSAPQGNIEAYLSYKRERAKRDGGV